MKSVVVEASTVAKAIEIAWLKAEKPAEFFIRILQEHQSGFLGFGSQKAKIVLFFKNSQKLDSSFPILLKQKEYASLFDNAQLKNPTHNNVIDAELNKNVFLQQKHKKQHKNVTTQTHTADRVKQAEQQIKKVHEKNIAPQDKQQKSVQKHAQPVKSQQIKPQHVQQPKKQLEHQVKEQHKKQQYVEPVAKKQEQVKSRDEKIQHHTKREKSQAKKTLEEFIDSLQVHHEMPVDLKPLTENQTAKFVAQTSEVLVKTEYKDDAVKDIARVLKKVQSQKVVSNVSRQVHAQHHGLDEKKNEVKSTVSKVEAQENQSSGAPKVVQRFKRRPLSTDFVQKEQPVSNEEKQVVLDQQDVDTKE